VNPVVLDTSVVIAASINPAGAAGSLLEAFYRDWLQLAYTTPMLDEYVSVMERPKFAAFIDANARLSVALKLRASGLLVEPAAVPKAAWPDIDDLPFVAAALATESKIVVTLNPRDFVPAAALGVRVLSPSGARRELL
jgi:putative PIN family toxin of toxin-antitoxin system